MAGDLGPKRTLGVALLLTNLVTGPLLTPFFLALVLWHLAVDGLPAPRGIAAILETTLAFSVIGLGAVGTLWLGWLGARRRGAPALRSLPVFLLYQLMIAAAAWGGVLDLVRRPYHWHKTPHGAAAARRVTPPASAAAPRGSESRRQGLDADPCGAAPDLHSAVRDNGSQPFIPRDVSRPRRRGRSQD